MWIYLGRLNGYTFSMRPLNWSLLIGFNAVRLLCECQNPVGHIWIDIYCCSRIFCFCFRCLFQTNSTNKSKLQVDSNHHAIKKPRLLSGAFDIIDVWSIFWNACPAKVIAHQAKPFWFNIYVIAIHAYNFCLHCKYRTVFSIRTKFSWKIFLQRGKKISKWRVIISEEVKSQNQKVKK